MTPKDVISTILEECGYNCSDIGYISSSGTGTITAYKTAYKFPPGWQKVRAGYYEIINQPLSFTVAIHTNGNVWLSKAIYTKELTVNIYDPKSIGILKKELIGIRESHCAVHSR